MNVYAIMKNERIMYMHKGNHQSVKVKLAELQNEDWVTQRKDDANLTWGVFTRLNDWYFAQIHNHNIA